MKKISDELYEEMKQGRLAEYITYHFLMDQIGDIDPSYPMLIYVCNRFELNLEQRYWLAFLFAATYCSPTVYYIYNEFPDYENVDVGRLQRWWAAHKNQCLFQSDRLWIRSRDQFVPMFQSYREHIGKYKTQEDAFDNLVVMNDLGKTYDNAYQYFKGVKYFGRFSMFLFLEAVHVVTGFPMAPTNIDWKNAESSRNGLCFALGYDQLINGHGHTAQLSTQDYNDLESDYITVMEIMKDVYPQSRIDAWNVETSLCAYKKWRLGKTIPKRITSPHYRYPGYYLDRQYEEILKMEKNVVDGVDWSVLWDFRAETYNHERLAEWSSISNDNWGEEEMRTRMHVLMKNGYIYE